MRSHQNRSPIAAVTGWRLIPTLAFDYPSAAAVASYLCEFLFETRLPRVSDYLASATAEELLRIVDGEQEHRPDP